MAGLNKLHMGVWGRSAKGYELNTFIGGLGFIYPTKEDLAVQFVSIHQNESALSYMKNYEVDVDGNISFFMEEGYYITSSIGSLGAELTYYYDKDGLLSNLGYRKFGASIPVKIIADNLINIGAQSFASGGGTKYYRFSKILQIQKGYKKLSNNSAKRLYLPNAKFVGDPSVNIESMRFIPNSAVIYIHPFEATSNGGLPNAELSYGFTKVYVTDFTRPNKVNDLDSSNVTTNSVKLNFTAPSSFNALDFYEVWIDDGVTIEFKYHFFDEIPSSGSILTGLSSGKTYQIKIVACDIYWNRSEFSNEITITTL